MQHGRRLINGTHRLPIHLLESDVLPDLPSFIWGIYFDFALVPNFGSPECLVLAQSGRTRRKFLSNPAILDS